uniref:Uncharacterized protein n=1 Tax=Chromera velia CCMP2878 TaxID=1169474 RepID=A0A0G4F0P9_9ALVE|eukprot:Cvel_2589.t1-p1 / transcript=Cvel_2589.t1 / gene=Cvel_2589 / organism=Chromera_velia_CCMP2878 / gene_product=Uncharacterized gene 48 protein, putative / transcript_product=Uncharacterized gene 48 protein, putative / location=Cvel_scaffold102:105133-105558(-) / protein_length=142 / sequence_SO=supercontig / SO=protein_coding / is_pseudo=false
MKGGEEGKNLMKGGEEGKNLMKGGEEGKNLMKGGEEGKNLMKGGEEGKNLMKGGEEGKNLMKGGEEGKNLMKGGIWIVTPWEVEPPTEKFSWRDRGSQDRHREIASEMVRISQTAWKRNNKTNYNSTDRMLLVLMQRSAEQP